MLKEKETILQEISLIKEELEESPESPQLLNDLGVGYYLVGEYLLSIESLKKAVHQEPENPVYHFNLRSEEHTSELQSRGHLVCRLLLEKKTDFENEITCLQTL